MVQGESLGAIALRATAEDPDRVVVIDEARTVRRGEILEMALRLVGALRACGASPGATIGIMLPNWWEACVINLAASLGAWRVVPLMTIYRSAELETILPDCEVEFLFLPERLGKTNFPALVAGLQKSPANIFTVRGDGPGPRFEDLLDDEPAEPEIASGSDIKLVFFTSGSTGRPKGVLHSHATIDRTIRDTAAFWGIGPQDTLYVPSPIGHIGGSLYAFEFPWITGCKTVLAERWAPDKAVADIDTHQASFMAGATPFLVGLLAASEAADTRLPSLRRYICGGASVPPELVRRGHERFDNAVVSRAYGSSEVPLVCPGVATRNEAAHHADTDGECTAELRLLDPAEDGSGEIAVRSPRMFLGYLDAADEIGAFTTDGYFRMGDLGRLVDGKYLEITGRTKDIIIRKGENISPLEIENALARNTAVRQSAVVGIPDSDRGEMVVAFVLPQVGARFDFAGMTEHLTSLGLAKQKFPERLNIVESMPTTAIGKVDKAALRKRAIEAVGVTP